MPQDYCIPEHLITNEKFVISHDFISIIRHDRERNILATMHVYFYQFKANMSVKWRPDSKGTNGSFTAA